MKKSLEWLTASANKLDVADSKKFHESISQKLDSKTKERQKKLFKKAKAVTS